MNIILRLLPLMILIYVLITANTIIVEFITMHRVIESCQTQGMIEYDSRKYRCGVVRGD